MRLAWFFRKLNFAHFWKSHISVKNDLFDLKIWLQRFLNMGYRMDIVKFKFEIFHVTRLWQDARFSHGPSLKLLQEDTHSLNKSSEIFDFFQLISEKIFVFCEFFDSISDNLPTLLQKNLRCFAPVLS
jgi:hypothetical protein